MNPRGEVWTATSGQVHCDGQRRYSLDPAASLASFYPNDTALVWAGKGSVMTRDASGHVSALTRQADIQKLKVSPDGKFLAVLADHWELHLNPF